MASCEEAWACEKRPDLAGFDTVSDFVCAVGVVVDEDGLKARRSQARNDRVLCCC